MIILSLILLVILVVLGILGVITTGFLFVFGDLIIFILIVMGIVKLCKKKKK